MEVLAKGRLGEGPRQPGETRADEWVQGPFRSWHVHVTLWAAFHSICMLEGVNVNLRFRQAAWPNRMDAEAVIPWSNLAEFLTQSLVSWVNNGTVSSPWVSGSTETLDGSLDRQGPPLKGVFGKEAVLLIVAVSGTFLLAWVARTRDPCHPIMAKTEPRDRDLSPPECQSTCPCQGMLPGSIQVNPPEQSNSPPQKEYWGALRPSIACCFEMSFSWFLFMDFLMGRPWVPQLGLSVCWPETRVCVQWPYGDSRHRHIIRMWGRSWARPQTPASPCQTPPSAKCSAHYTLWFPQWFLRVFFSIFKSPAPWWETRKFTFESSKRIGIQKFYKSFEQKIRRLCQSEQARQALWL